MKNKNLTGELAEKPVQGRQVAQSGHDGPSERAATQADQLEPGRVLHRVHQLQLLLHDSHTEAGRK